MTVWDERFTSTGGKNGDGDCPLHVVCCDPLVSLQAIVLVDRQADVLAVADGEQCFLPTRFAANCGASLRVISYLLQHCPDALRHVAGSTVSYCRSVSTVPSNGGIVEIYQWE